VYVLVTVLTIVYEQVRLLKDRWVRQLTTALHVERDLITAMKDNLKSGLFLMDKDHVIQGSYSKPLEALLGTDEIEGKKFTDFLGASLKAKERDTLEDYFSMVINRSYDVGMLDDINPISEFTYLNELDNTTKTLRGSFASVDQGRGANILFWAPWRMLPKRGNWNNSWPKKRANGKKKCAPFSR